MSTKLKYLHLINGKPAYFSEKHRLLLLAQRHDRIRLADSLDQIRREQNANIGKRTYLNYETNPRDYTHALVRVKP